jgi:Protein of unknown function (DUF1045)
MQEDTLPPDQPRYAAYFAPDPASELGTFGSSAIGYDAATGLGQRFLSHPGFTSDEWHDLTAEPRRYGFHATMKAPFHLAAGTTEADLLQGFDRCASRLSPVVTERLKLAFLDNFIALVPVGDASGIAHLAMAVVEGLEPFRARLAAADRARRLAASLTPRQVGNLDQYGYPHVGPDFRFHMTLTGAVAPVRQQPAWDALAAAFDQPWARQPVEITSITLFRQDTRAGRFRMIHQRKFGG